MSASLRIDDPSFGLVSCVGSRLDAAAIPWLVFGSAACSAYGLERAPNDVDVIAAAEPDHLATLFPESRARGTNGRVLDAVELWSAPLWLRGCHVLDLDAQMLARRRVARCGEHLVPLVSVEDAVVVKAILGRERDYGDVRAVLERQHRAIDHTYLGMRALRCGAPRLVARFLARVA